MDKNSFILSKNDTPQARKKKIQTFYWGLVVIFFLAQAWPLAILLLVLNKQIIDSMEKSALKKYGLVNREPETNGSQTQDSKYYRQYTRPNVIKTDYQQARVAIIGFIALAMLFLAYLYWQGSNDHPEYLDWINKIKNIL